MYRKCDFHLAIISIFCSLAFAQASPPSPSPHSSWNILVEGGKGEYRNNPVCHPLKYFYGSPFLFDFESDLYGMKPKDVRVATDEFPVGTINGRKILQIDQRITDQRTNDGELIMKRLLVQRRDDEFCAIYQQQYPAAMVKVTTAKIETISGEQILETKDANGEHGSNEAYWAFDADGPILLDLSLIQRELTALVPTGDEVRMGNGLNLAALCYRNSVWKQDDCNACASGGTVTLKLAFRNHQLVVLRKRYDPNGDPNSARGSELCIP